MRTLLIFLSLLAFALIIENNVDASPTTMPFKSTQWKIKNKTWTDVHEAEFQSFVHTLGMARKKGVCTTLDQCLKNEIANPMYADLNPENLDPVYADCADLPFILRAYFAWMNDLPFTYPTDLVAAGSLSKKESDIRYSKYGNLVTDKYFVKKGDNINRILQNVVDSISTGSLRTDPSVSETGRLFRDTYSVDIDRRSIVPGTVVYDPNGHIAVVYEVTKTGQIQMIDSHPDNTLTTITYGEKFPRSALKIGAGLSRFRPFSLENGVTAPANDELTGFSLVQYQSGPFIFKDKIVTYYEYVRQKLSDGDIIYDPLTEFSDLMDELCLDTKYREEAVKAALLAGIDQKEHPSTLPKNIYGTDGEWEIYATPSRDARLKALVRETRDYLKKIVTGHALKKIKIKYAGEDMIKDLRELYQKKSKACHVRPTPGIELDLDVVLKKIYDLSFDPYHCPSLRWGLDDKSCKDRDWYAAESGLRGRIAIDVGLKTDFSVSELPSAPASQVEKENLSFASLLGIER